MERNKVAPQPFVGSARHGLEYLVVAAAAGVGASPIVAATTLVDPAGRHQSSRHVSRRPSTRRHLRRSHPPFRGRRTGGRDIGRPRSGTYRQCKGERYPALLWTANLMLAQASGVLEAIRRACVPRRRYRFMEFCGGHTHALFRHGLLGVLPREIDFVHGPGCPVCVLPVGRLDMALQLLARESVILCCYGDLIRVPGSGGRSLARARAEGAEVRMVYSCLEALALAEREPRRQIVFFAIGFETTTPATAVLLKEAKRRGIRNLSVFVNHVLTPAAMLGILESKEVRSLGTLPLDGFVGPGHVAAIIGSQPFAYFAQEYQKPVVIAGFEPGSLLTALHRLLLSVNEGRFDVQNAYHQVVNPEGNPTAKALVAECFSLRKWFEWRGLGVLPYSAFRLREPYLDFDAETRFAMEELKSPEQPGCLCGAVLRGVIKPEACPLFGRTCTPANPVGSCMVSSEGACAASFHFGNLRGEG